MRRSRERLKRYDRIPRSEPGWERTAGHSFPNTSIGATTRCSSESCWRLLEASAPRDYGSGWGTAAGSQEVRHSEFRLLIPSIISLQELQQRLSWARCREAPRRRRRPSIACLLQYLEAQLRPDRCVRTVGFSRCRPVLHAAICEHGPL